MENSVSPSTTTRPAERSEINVGHDFVQISLRKEYNAPAPPFIYLIQVTFGLEEHTIGLLSQVKFYADLYWRFM